MVDCRFWSAAAELGDYDFCSTLEMLEIRKVILTLLTLFNYASGPVVRVRMDSISGSREWLFLDEELPT
jgi:hypothetical protein